MDKAYFQVIYEGPALENHEMDVRDLAPALIAVADLLEEANTIINGGGTKVNVNVRGSFKSGSFGIEFNLIQTTYQEILKMFGPTDFTAAINLLTLIGFIGVGSKGLISLLKLLRNRSIQKIDNLENNRVVIQISPNEKYEYDTLVLDLYKNQRIRDSIDKIITEPLSIPGINEFKVISSKDTDAVVVTSEEKDFFQIPLMDDEILGESITDAYLQVVSVSFKEDNKWRFSRGELTFFASIQDKDFLKRIDLHDVHFAKDDILKVRLLTKDILTNKGIRPEYVIIEVLEHRSSERQLPLIPSDKNN